MRAFTTWCLLLLLLLLGAHSGALSPGSYLYYYTSAIDGSCQPYGLYLPSPFVTATPHPVIFTAHGFGGCATAYFNSAQMHFADTYGFLLVQLQGRGNTFYDGVGEVDFFDVLADLRAKYNIDLRRLYFEGGSMGATGAYRLGIRHPDVLAAVGGFDGWADYRAWYTQWYGPEADPAYVEPFRMPNLLMDSCVDVAEGARWQHLYLVADSYDSTVPPINSYNLNDRLDALGSVPGSGYAHTLQTVYGGHCAAYTQANQIQLYRYFLTKTLPVAPKHVTCKTTRLKYGRMYWVRIDRLQRANEFATVDATVTGNTVSVSTENVLQYTLFLDASLLDPSRLVTIICNGLTCYAGPLRAVTLYATLHSSGAVINWTERNELPGGPWKRAGMEGPIGEAYTTRFIVVYGTSGSAADTIANRVEANTFCQVWNQWMGGGISARADTSITAGDIAQSNLILFGTTESNAILQRIQAELPIHVSDTGISVGTTRYHGTNFGAYFIYPNPLNPAHYVVISHLSIPGATPKDLEALPWYWPDYVVFDITRQPGACIQSELAYLPDTFVDAGYFDNHWRLNIGPAQPDLLIRTEAQNDFVGANIYNNLANQTVGQSVAPRATAVYYAEVRNNGGLDDTFLLTATPGAHGMTVKYIDVPTGQEVTTLLTNAAGWRIPLDQHAARQLRIEVTLDATLPTGATRDVLVSVASLADSTQTDQVKAVSRKE